MSATRVGLLEQMTREDLEALIRKVLAEMPELTGPQGKVGPQGERGDSGPPGPSIPPDRLKSLIIDVVLAMPELRGADGVSDVPGPRGEPGPKPTPQEIRDVVSRMQELRGPPGESIVGPPGPKGDRGPEGQLVSLKVPISDGRLDPFMQSQKELIGSLHASLEELAQRVDALETRKKEK